MQLDDMTKQAIQAARVAFGAQQVLLFGSRSRDEATNESDVDLCFLFQQFSQDPMELMYQIRRMIHASTDEALDILVYEQGAFESKAKLSNSFEHSIRAEGVAV